MHDQSYVETLRRREDSGLERNRARAREETAAESTHEKTRAGDGYWAEHTGAGSEWNTKTKLGMASCRTKQAPERGHTEAGTSALTRAPTEPRTQSQKKIRWPSRRSSLDETNRKKNLSQLLEPKQRAEKSLPWAHCVAAKQKLQTWRTTVAQEQRA
jgi:hypothetical protein